MATVNILEKLFIIYYTNTLFYLFCIYRVLLERLIVNRPHPWGLLITFIDLIKNPTYNFWKHEFVHCAPEIEKLVLITVMITVMLHVHVHVLATSLFQASKLQPLRYCSPKTQLVFEPLMLVPIAWLK